MWGGCNRKTVSSVSERKINNTENSDKDRLFRGGGKDEIESAGNAGESATLQYPKGVALEVRK